MQDLHRKLEMIWKKLYSNTKENCLAFFCLSGSPLNDALCPLLSCKAHSLCQRSCTVFDTLELTGATQWGCYHT